MSKIDTSNDFGVGVQGEDIRIMMPPAGRIDRDRALRLAAWIVLLIDYDGRRFEEIKKAVASA